MPHVPKPLGSFPLVLRDYRIANPRKGELLLNYNDYELYYCNMNGNVISMAQEIYDKILSSKLQNTYIYIADADKQNPIPQSNEVWPRVDDRMYNGLYFVVRSRYKTTIEE